ncbi:hypothetical protein RDWZM_000626 [Blomia tropicalis]|uniref:Ubiquitin thioesterase OTU n=1 Tax=Blomia tropicalis TaxID=40697 RepID=A0A9Q0RPU4_BLOTA|nr:aminotransferase [Blomia tropicalis]KAJ6222081.1 hypothetical protein RDWZM_000626 [Blomia tropicalis]
MASVNNLKIQVRTRNGQHIIDSLSTKDSVAQLKATIWSLTSLHPDTCKVLIGYPPEELFLVDDDQLIGDIIKRPRETLILQEIVQSSVGNGEQLNKFAEPMNKVQIRREMRRVEVPANNSCLFVSVNFCMTNKMMNKCPQLRELIAETVKNDPITYNEGFLGKPNTEYCTWIRNEDHWGGGIELAILSKYYGVEIVAVDTQNIRLNRFGEDQDYQYRIFLIFDGIHYDPLIIESTDVNNPTQTKFATTDTQVIEMALEFARVAKEKHQFTDLKRMQLRCNNCKQSFPPEQARAHASATGHLDFSEVK